MNIADKITQIAENEPKVYEAGKKAEWNAFWDIITNYGQRTDYYRAFCYWGAEYIRPNRKIMFTTVTNGSLTFGHNPKLKKVEAAYFDFSQKPRGTNSSNAYFYTFYNCPELEEVEDIGIQADFNFAPNGFPQFLPLRPHPHRPRYKGAYYPGGRMPCGRR